MVEVDGDPAVVEGLAATMRRSIGRVNDAAARVEVRAAAYAAGQATIATADVRVPPKLGEVVAWVEDLAQRLDLFGQGLAAADTRHADGPPPHLDRLRIVLEARDHVETGLHVALTRWGDVRRHSTARLRLWRMDRSLTTAGDYRGTGLARPARRALMRQHNRPIRNDIHRLRRQVNATGGAVARGRGGAWTHVRSVSSRVATRFPRATSVARAGGRVLAVAGVVMSGHDVVMGLRHGDAERVGLGAAGLGAAAAFAAGGPIGIAVGVSLVVGSLAWENREAIAQYGRRGLESVSSVAASASASVSGAASDAVAAAGDLVDGAGDALRGATTGIASTMGGWFD